MSDRAEKRLGSRSEAAMVDKILSILATRAATIEQLTELVPSKPTTIGLVLDELSVTGRVKQCDAGVYRRNDTGPVGIDLGDVEVEYWRRQALFPLPHQLDGDWRFTFEAASDLVQMMDFALADASKICCLGTPSIAVLLDIKQVRSNIVLIDYNRGVLDAVRNTCQRVQCVHWDMMNRPHVEPLGSYDVVFVDPPWAGDYCSRFAQASVSLLADGGFGCLVYFPPYLRSSAPQRQVELITALAEMNARILAVLPERVNIIDVLRSKSLAGGMRCVTHTGAKGTVCVFEKLKRGIQCNDSGWDLPSKGQWLSFNIGQSKWMLRVDAHGTAEGEPHQLKRLADESEFTRYDRNAEQVGLWTSGGQVFSVCCTDAVAVLLNGMTNDQSFVDLREDLDMVVKDGVSLEICWCLWMQLQGIRRRESEIENMTLKAVCRHEGLT